MGHKKIDCFDQLHLRRFLDEQLSSKDDIQVVEHIGMCTDCQDQLASISGGQTGWQEFRENLSQLPRDRIATRQHEASDDQTGDGDSLSEFKALLAPTDDPRMLGRLGNYEITAVLGQGGTGVVFKALDPRLNRYIAIKMLARGYSHCGASHARFEREARAIAAVRDDHVIPIHGVDEFGGSPYIVMQYMPFGSLQRRIDCQGPLSTQKVVRIGMQIARGLAAAHRQGIIHRDVKPANVLLEDGVERAVVTDFGLARVVDEATTTRSGSISGTPQYMSPEQARGESLDIRSDLFSLGSVMYAMCTGRTPFRSETLFGVIKRVCETRPRPIRETNPEISEWLADFIEKLQAKERGQRFDSAEQVAELLALELAHLNSPTTVPEPVRDWRQQDATPKDSALNKFPNRAAVVVISVSLLVTLMWAIFAWNGSRKNEGAFMPSPDTKSSDSAKSNDQARFHRDTAQSEAVSNLVTNFNDSIAYIQRDARRTVLVESGGRLVIDTNFGTLNITTHDLEEVRFRVACRVSAEDKELAGKIFDAVQLDFNSPDDLKDRGLEAGRDAFLKADLFRQMDRRFGNAKARIFFDIQVPSTIDLELRTNAGNIQVSDVNGNVTLQTGHGAVFAGNIDGTADINVNRGSAVLGNVSDDATIKASNGSIDIGVVGGNLNAESVGGSIVAHTVKGTAVVKTDDHFIKIHKTFGIADARTQRGFIELSQVHDSVSAETQNGRLHVNFVGQPSDESRLNTSGGAVHVGLLQTLDLDIHASTDGDTMVAPFINERAKTAEHRLNEGDCILNVSTVTGPIRFGWLPVEKVQALARESTERCNPGGHAWFDHACELHMTGNMDEAIPAHRKAIELGNNVPLATFNLACAWAHKGDEEKAFGWLTRAIDRGFDNYQLMESNPDFEKLRLDDRFLEAVNRTRHNNRSNQDDDREINELPEPDSGERFLP